MKPWQGVVIFLVLMLVLIGFGVIGVKGLRGLVGPPGHRVVLRCDLARVPDTGERTMDDVMEVLRNRLDALGVAEPALRRRGADKVVVDLPATLDVKRAVAFLTAPGLLRFVYIKGLQSDRHPTNFRYEAEARTDGKGNEHWILLDRVKGGAEVNQEDFFDNHQDEYVVVLTGRELIPSKIQANYKSGTTEPEVALRFNREGAKRFADFTGSHIGDRLCIEFDKHLLSAPRINEGIPGGKASISGGFRDIEEAQQLADLLRSGALPAPLEVVGSPGG